MKLIAIGRHRTLALVLLVTAAASTAVVVSRSSDDLSPNSAVSGSSSNSTPPDVRVDPGSSTVRISAPTGKRSSARVAQESDPTDAPAPVPPGLPGTPAGGYELAEPGDRTPPAPPDFVRSLNGSLDDSRGAPLFASFCPYSHSRPDDPIVYPRSPGASHLHDFFGNKKTDAYSTDDTLRDAGTTTCVNFPDSAAYWVPALYENGNKVTPASVSAYYTAGPKDFRTIEPFPKGLKVLVKDAKASSWYCTDSRTSEPYDDPPLCPTGSHLSLQIVFPDCWDGKYLDVPDHRSHVAYAEGRMCPRSHPVPVPQLTQFVDYTASRGGIVELAPLSNPSAPHADFVNSWDQGRLTKFVRDCINAGVHCGSEAPS